MTGAVGAPAAIKAAMASELGGLKLQVTPENVLRIHHAILAESRLLGSKVGAARFKARVGPAGQDPVSTMAMIGFNSKIDALLTQCQAYVDALAAVADELAQMAMRYGHSEQQIQDSFSEFLQSNPPPLSVPSSPAMPGPTSLNFARSIANHPPVAAKPPSLFPGVGEVYQ